MPLQYLWEQSSEQVCDKMNVMATKTKAKRLTPTEQHARFVEAAKKAEADEAPEAMDKAFTKLSIRRSGQDSLRKRAKP